MILLAPENIIWRFIKNIQKPEIRWERGWGLPLNVTEIIRSEINLVPETQFENFLDTSKPTPQTLEEGVKLWKESQFLSSDHFSEIGSFESSLCFCTPIISTPASIPPLQS